VTGKEEVGCYVVASLGRLLEMIGLLCREYSLFYRAFLQKRPILLRGIIIVATP